MVVEENGGSFPGGAPHLALGDTREHLLAGRAALTEQRSRSSAHTLTTTQRHLVNPISSPVDILGDTCCTGHHNTLTDHVTPHSSHNTLATHCLTALPALRTACEAES